MKAVEDCSNTEPDAAFQIIADTIFYACQDEAVTDQAIHCSTFDSALRHIVQRAEKAEAACAELREAYESYKSTCRESHSQENILMAQAGLFAVLDESLKGGEE